MKRLTTVRHEFVEVIPDDLKEGTLYVSMTYATVVHKCCCGCGSQVVTPLSPTDWSLTFNGKTISLAPSIGNWSFPCKSHYWITNSEVRWARKWSQGTVDRGRALERSAKDAYFDAAAKGTEPSVNDSSPKAALPSWLELWRSRHNL